MQYIIICLDDSDPNGNPKDSKTYVQASRIRYKDHSAALYRAEGIAKSRNPVVVPVPDVPIDKYGYPTTIEPDKCDCCEKERNYAKCLTGEHPVLTKDGKWIEAKNITNLDDLVVISS